MEKETGQPPCRQRLQTVDKSRSLMDVPKRSACWRKLISGTPRKPQNLSEILPEFPKLQMLLLTYPGDGATLIGTDPDAMVRLVRLGLVICATGLNQNRN